MCLVAFRINSVALFHHVGVLCFRLFSSARSLPHACPSQGDCCMVTHTLQRRSISMMDRMSHTLSVWQNFFFFFPTKLRNRRHAPPILPPSQRLVFHSQRHKQDVCNGVPSAHAIRCPVYIHCCAQGREYCFILSLSLSSCHLVSTWCRCHN